MTEIESNITRAVTLAHTLQDLGLTNSCAYVSLVALGAVLNPPEVERVEKNEYWQFYEFLDHKGLSANEARIVKFPITTSGFKDTLTQTMVGGTSAIFQGWLMLLDLPHEEVNHMAALVLTDDSLPIHATDEAFTLIDTSVPDVTEPHSLISLTIDLNRLVEKHDAIIEIQGVFLHNTRNLHSALPLD